MPITSSYEPTPPNRLDTSELQNIKSKFEYKNRLNAELYESNQLAKRNPQVIFDTGGRKPSALSSSVLKGLSYPLRLNGSGGLATSSNYDRIGEQILEVLQTRIGERVMKQFFGLPELIFETIDEYSLAQTIKSQLKASLAIVPELDVRVEMDENGNCAIYVWYSEEGLAPSMVKYSFAV